MASSRELKTGNWQAQVRRRGQKPGVRNFKTRFEAERWGRLMESEIDRGVFFDSAEAERGTIGELIDRYLSEVTPMKKSAKNERQRLQALKPQYILKPSHLSHSHRKPRGQNNSPLAMTSIFVIHNP
jgi:hypothetical protein